MQAEILSRVAAVDQSRGKAAEPVGTGNRTPQRGDAAQGR